MASRTLCNWKAALNKSLQEKEKYICHSPHCTSKKSRCVQKGLNVPSISVQTLKMDKGAKTAVLYMFKSETTSCCIARLHTGTMENEPGGVAAHDLSSRKRQKPLRGLPASGRRLFNLPCDNKGEAEGQIAAPAGPRLDSDPSSR